MEIIVGKHAGFCFGVRRAMEIAENATGGNRGFGKVYTLGDLIHNEEAIKELELKGIVSKSLEELLTTKPSRVIIRSHGVAKSEIEALIKAGHEVIDATCPFVKKIHKIAEDYSGRGYHILIVGDKDHAEVKGIIGWINGSGYSVINSKEDAENFSLDIKRPICIVSQTTFNAKKYKEYVEIVTRKGYDIYTLDTICSATMDRQTEALQIASKVDAMIVIGGTNSSNSRKLYEVAKGKCKSYFLQTKADLDPTVLCSINKLGITAGASTPDNIIREVISECQK